MSAPPFLVADTAHRAWRSPLQRALSEAPPGVRDVSAEAVNGVLGPACGLAGIEIEAVFARRLLGRLTELEPPAVGMIARVRGEVISEGENRYRIWVGREHADYLAAVILDAWEGLA